MTRRWPQFASPGWLAAYTAGLVAWLAIYDWFGAVVVLSIVAFGVLALGAAWDWTSCEGGKRNG